MTISSNIMLRDLARMASGADSQLHGRATHDSSVLAELAFRDKHGLARSDYQAREQQFARERWENKVLAGLDADDAPADVACDVRGLPPMRARLARYLAWRAAHALALTDLETRAAQLRDMTTAPKATESMIAQAVQRTADWLLGRGVDAGDETHRQKLDAELAILRHRSEAAAKALPQIEKEIEAAQMRLDHLQNREAEFLRPAIIEAVDAVGKAYVVQIAKLRSMLADILELNQYLGGRSHLSLPHPNIPSLEGANLEIVAAKSGRWRDLESALIADPRGFDPSKYLPKMRG